MPAKRPNAILIGTLLVVLIGALIFVQSQFMPAPEEDDGHGHNEPTAPSANTPGHTPTVEELQNQLKGTGEGPTTSPQPPNSPSPVQIN